MNQEPPVRGPGHVSGDADRALLVGLRWTGFGTAVNRVIHIAFTVVILQKLSFAEMGRWAAVWSVMVVIEAFSGLGVNFAIVRMHELSMPALRSLFWVSTMWGVLLASALAAAAPLIGRWYSEPALTPLLLVVCVKLVFIGPAMVPWGLIGKRMGFRDATMAETIAGIFEALTSIVLVLAGFGVFGLVWGVTARAFVYLIVVFAIEPVRPSLRMPLGEVGRAVWFGLHVVASNLVYQLYRNMDYFLIGLRLGVAPLGVYRVGFEVGMSPFETTSTVAIRAAYPVLCSVSKDPQAIRDTFTATARSLWLFLLPIACLLAIEGHDLVKAIAADRWLAAVPVVQILCWAGVFRGLVQLFGPLFQAIGRPRLAVYESLLTGTLLVAGFALAISLAPANKAILWIACVWVLVYPGVLLFDLTLARRVAGVSVWDLLRAVAPLLPGVPLMLAAMALTVHLTSEFLNKTPRLLVVGAVGIAIFYLYTRIFVGRSRSIGQP